MKLKLFLILVITLKIGFGLRWPLYHPNNSYHRITGCFGEFRTGPYHIHAGVDIVKYDGNTIAANVFSVQNDVIAWVQYTGSASNSYVQTYWHGYWHMQADDGYDPGDPLAEDEIFGFIMDWQTQTHLHFGSHGSYIGSEDYNKHNHHPNQNLLYRLDPLNPDTMDPQIFGNIIFALDGDPTTTYSANNIPVNQNIDIIVHAEDSRIDYGITDPNNGIYKIGYSIDNPGYYNWKIIFDYTQNVSNWNVNYVYDTTRSNNSDYYYIVTNNMNSNDYWQPTLGSHTVYIRAEDEYGEYAPKQVQVQVITGIEEANNHPFTRTCVILPNPGGRMQLDYQIANPTTIQITVFDCAGRIIRRMEKEDNPGEHTFIWEGMDETGKSVTSGCYFVKFEAGDYKVTKKFILVK